MRAVILPPTPENLATAAGALEKGAVVGIPTETVYGLAGAALDPLALARIFETKERPTFDPLIIHVGHSGKGVHELEHLKLVDLSKVSESSRDQIQRLIEAFWPGPLTLVLPKNPLVPDLATSGLPTVALRMPRHSTALALIALAKMPLAAPSANRFGRISPTTAQAVADELGDRIDLILDGGPCEVGLESTVIGLQSDGTWNLLRPGGTPESEITAVLGAPLGKASSSEGPQAAPGMMESHYAPSKRLTLLSGAASAASFSQLGIPSGKPVIGLLLISGDGEKATVELSQLTGCRVITRVLSPTGDLREAAHRLFAELRFLDQSEAEFLVAEPCAADAGLGHAIADRLRRAASPAPK